MKSSLTRSLAALLLATPISIPLVSPTLIAEVRPAGEDVLHHGKIQSSEGVVVPWRMTLLDGRKNTPVSLAPTAKKEGLTQFSLDRFDVEVIVNTSERGYTELLVRISNKSDDELWLEPGFSVDFPAKSPEWFDGYQTRKVFSRREILTGSFPFASVHHNQSGLALGLDPRELVSHFRSALRKSGEESSELSFSSRMVIPAKQTKERRFVAFGYQPDFGYLNAVQKYWGYFPENYQAHEGISPDVKGTVFGSIVWMTQHFQYHDGPQGKYNDKVSEVVRWIGGGWEWCYAGYGTRPGDWLCTEEISFDWKVNPEDPKSPDKTTALRDVLKRNAKEHLEGLMENYRRMDSQGVAPLMYIIPSYCEAELAEGTFADSIYRDPQNNPRSSGPPWVGRFDKSHQMYSYGNSFGDYTLEAIKTIVERTPGLRGFSFDCIDRSNYNYTGTGVERSPGKAYDANLGVHVNTEIAHVKFGEAVHALEKDGYRMALSGNFRAASGSYLSAQAMDAMIIEHTPWDERPLPGMIRLHAGTKSVSFLHGYERVPDIDNLGAEELIQTTKMLQDFSILQAYRYGIYPSWKSALGAPKMIYHFGIFNDLFRHYGWQPAPGARSDEALWVSRYGAKPGSILSIGNATDKEVTAPVEILPRYFGGESIAFVDYEGGHPVTTKIRAENTVIEGRYLPGEASIYAAALVWEKPLVGEVVAERKVSRGSANVDTFQLKPLQAKGGEAKAFVSERPGYQIISVSFEGAPISFEKREHGIAFSHPLRPGTLRVEQTPLVGTQDPAALTKLAFLNEEKDPIFQVVLLNDTAATRRESMKLKGFFSGYRYGLDEVDKVVDIPVLSDVKAANPELLTVYIGSAGSLEETPFSGQKPPYKAGSVMVHGNAVALVAKGDADLTATGNLLLDLLTLSYPHYGRLHISSKSISGGAGIFSPSLFQKVTGMDYLPWKSTSSKIEGAANLK